MVAALLPYAQYVIYFTAGFMVIPTGRDVVAVGYPLLPGDDKLLPAFCNGFTFPSSSLGTRELHSTIRPG